MNRRKPLKRSWLKRKPPKHRTTKKPKRKNSAVLKKQAKEGARRDYKAMFPRCQFIGCRKPATDTHEVLRGAHRTNSYGERACSLNLCRDHHNEVGRWPVAKQFALKRIADPEGYDLNRVNEVYRGESLPESAVIVTEEDVAEATRELKCID